MKKTNYHTHTPRCMHAVGEEREYIDTAIEHGYEILGFSDHTPWLYESDYVATMRMPLSQFPDYKAKVLSLKSEYESKIQILLGLEVEYFPKYMDWLKKFIVEEDLDYIILGHHFRETDEYGGYYGTCVKTHDDLEEYINSAIAAMKTGLYSYMAHPDLFMRGYNNGVFDEFAGNQVRRLCAASKKYDVPFEYNINGLNYNVKMGIENYPHHAFWEIAGEEGVSAYIGVDAHDPKLIARDDYYQEAFDKLTSYGVTICDEIDTSRLKRLKEAN